MSTLNALAEHAQDFQIDELMESEEEEEEESSENEEEQEEESEEEEESDGELEESSEEFSLSLFLLWSSAVAEEPAARRKSR